MTTEHDFRLDDFEPADTASELAESSPRAGDLTVLAEHHTTPNGSCSYLVAHPLPEPPEHHGDGTTPQTRAALTRSTSPSATPKAGLGTSTARWANTAQRPNPRRPM